MVQNRIPRVTGKIFASNAAEGDIGQFGSALTGTKVPTDDISIIQALPAYEEGWRGAVVSDRNYPTLPEMNGLQKTFSQQINYILQNGMPEWDAGTTYFTDQFCRVGSMFYVSLQDNNLGNNPTTTTGFWEIWNPAEGTYANTDLSNLSETGQQVINSKLNENQVTNCILSSSNANITNASVSDASYVNTGCTISEAGVASGFSADNRILLSKTMSSATASTVEIPFTTGSDVNTDQTLLYMNNHANSLGISQGKIVLRYDGNILSGTTTLAANTAYVALLTRTASNYTVQVKTAAGAYDDAEITLASAVGYFAGKSIYVGGGDDSYFRGSVDLANLVIQENASNYWTYTTLSSFQTVTVSGTYQLLMPNGRNADKTLNNMTKSVTLNDTLLYSPANGEKTVLVKEDGELMIRDYYAETYNQPADVPLNGVWMNKTANTLTEQLNTYPNFINTGVTIASNGNVTGFSASAYIELPESYTLGNNWELNYNADISSINGSTIVYTPDDTTGNFRAFKVTSEEQTVTAQFKRPDVYVVNREITVSTAYEVQKTDSSGGEPVTVTGYVQTQGEAESYVTGGTQVYSDSGFQTPLEQAAADTWTYTGDSVANTEVQTGYTKTGGVTLVPASTVVYSDANCTSVQGTASGTDYTYTGDTVESIICTLTDTLSVNTMTAGKIGFNGSQYYLNDQTYASTDTVKDNVNIIFGSDGQTFLDQLSLPETTLTISGETAWDWNTVPIPVEDFVSFVGAKIGNITDNGTTITSMTIDMPLTLAKDTDVVHNTGDENIEGLKTFEEDLCTVQNVRPIAKAANKGQFISEYNFVPTSTVYPAVTLKHNTITLPDENLPVSMLGRFCCTDSQGWIIGGMNVGVARGNIPITEMAARAYRNGVNKYITAQLSMDANGNGTFIFPRCTSRPSTTSTAANNRVAVVVANYYSGTTWWRLWSDNFLEQGGIHNYNQSTYPRSTITFPKTYNNTNYSILLTANQPANVNYSSIGISYTKNKNSFVLAEFNIANFTWRVSGYVT